MYSITNYGRMISDSVRMNAYIAALKKVIRKDSVVVDIGTGTGIFALLACHMGARYVYAIEPSDGIALAQELSQANGYADQIEFIQGISADITIPDLANVIISDLRGVLPIYGTHIPSIIDARQRFLAPGGVLIPQRDCLWVAAIESDEIYDNFSTPWKSNTFGLDLRAARKYQVNSWRKERILPEQIITGVSRLLDLDYTSIDSANVSGQVELRAIRSGIIHGVAVWFEAELLTGVSFSTSPWAQETIYGNPFFPLEKPVSIDKDDSILVSFKADLIDDNYMCRWETRISSRDGYKREKAHFKQSTFFSQPLVLKKLHRKSVEYVPTIRGEGEVECFILEQMRTGKTLGEIAGQLQKRNPEQYSHWKSALARVSETAIKYGK